MCYPRIMMIDFHCHRPDSFAVACTDRPSGTGAACPSSALVRCEGLLPPLWTQEKQEILFSRLESQAELQLGEVGLDRRFKDCVPMEKQAEILRTMLRFASEHGKCVSLHCVQATALMLDILRETSFRPYSVLWHGFSGSAETAAVLSKLKVIVSAGPRFRGSLKEIAGACPALVPETDYEGADKAGHLEILSGMYRRFSDELGMAPDLLEEHARKHLDAFCPTAGC